MANKKLDDLARALGKDPDRIRREALRELKEREDEWEKEHIDFEDSITPKATTFLIRIPRLSEKASTDPVKRQAVLLDAMKTVRKLKRLLDIAERTVYLASEGNVPLDLLEWSRRGVY